MKCQVFNDDNRPRRAAAADMTKPLHLLREMIAIPSVNPMRSDSGEAVERGMADFIQAFLRRNGIDCERQTVTDGRENVIGIVHSNRNHEDDRDGLMFNSHMDTVPVANMSIDPFDPIIKEDRVLGRGSCDAKGSLASMLAAVVDYAGQPHRQATVVFAAMADEEFSFSGSWKLIEKDWPVSACIVGEPTKLATVIAHKGVARWRLNVIGLSAHGATPERGRSAIYDGARVALALEQYAEQLRTKPPHPLLGQPTINVGRASAGHSVNIVPDLCSFEIERRLLPGEDGRAAIENCAQFLRERVSDEVQFQFEEAYLIDPALETLADARVVLSLGSAQNEEFGARGSIQGANYCTDGSKVSRAGIQTVVCGPGDIAQAHTADEFIEIQQLEAATRLYRRLISNWVDDSKLI